MNDADSDTQTVISTTDANKALVVRAITGVFVDRDKSLPGLLFATDYKQHNPAIPNGNTALPALIDELTDTFSYELGMVVAENDLVMVHGRYVGWGPKPMIAVDIFRVAGERIVEHWDVMQEEVPAPQTASGNPMFTAAEPAARSGLS